MNSLLQQLTNFAASADLQEKFFQSNEETTANMTGPDHHSGLSSAEWGSYVGTAAAADPGPDPSEDPDPPRYA